jgi:SAM-dependent methyltransferase
MRAVTIESSPLESLINLVRTAREKGAVVGLDVGCGRGMSTQILEKRLGGEYPEREVVVVGIDPDTDRLPLGAQFFSLRVEELTGIPELEGQFGLVSYSLPYPLPEDRGDIHPVELRKRRGVFQAMERLTEPGGWTEVQSEDSRLRELAGATWGASELPAARQRGLRTLSTRKHE